MKLEILNSGWYLKTLGSVEVGWQDIGVQRIFIPRWEAPTQIHNSVSVVNHLLSTIDGLAISISLVLSGAVIFLSIYDGLSLWITASPILHLDDGTREQLGFKEPMVKSNTPQKNAENAPRVKGKPKTKGRNFKQEEDYFSYRLGKE